MADCVSCVLTFMVPCAITLSCSMCCVGCCCYWSKKCPNSNVAEEDDGTIDDVYSEDGVEGNFAGYVVTEQPLKRYDTLKKRMVEAFRSGWSSLGKREKEKNDSKSVMKIQQNLNDKEWCSVCWEGYDNIPSDHLVGQIKKCGHYFHFDCLWAWLENHKTCPLCREVTDLKEEDITGIPLKILRADNVFGSSASSKPSSDSLEKTKPSSDSLEKTKPTNQEPLEQPRDQSGDNVEEQTNTTEDSGATSSDTAEAPCSPDTDATDLASTDTRQQSGTDNLGYVSE